MGGTTFGTGPHPGATAQDAFKAAVDEAHYDYGHSGYTGTIAECDGWVLCSDKPMSLNDAVAEGIRLIEADDPRISDKWGPAGVIPLVEGGWYFFGWASC